MSKKILMVLIIASFGYSEACVVGQTSSSTNCVTINTSCEGKVSSGESCTTDFYRCMASIALPYSPYGTWQHQGSVTSYVPLSDQQCPLY